MVGLRQAVLDPVSFEDHVRVPRPRGDRVPVLRLLGELDAVVGQDGVDLLRCGDPPNASRICRRTSQVRRLPASSTRLGDGELTGPADADGKTDVDLGGGRAQGAILQWQQRATPKGDDYCLPRHNSAS